MSGAPAITPEIAAEHGLDAEEYAKILEIVGRPPNVTELGIYSVMWSEHCSYKSSKKWLRLLPTTAPWVICGPGENAGVVDIGDGLAAVFKMESHNHPSFIEPYQGAATGVGGIMRDVFTMGARPIANLNALRFGDPDNPKTRHLVAGVVAGIGGYGNCIGVPTVAGETNFHAGYDGNILVNAMTVGIASADRIFYSAAAGPGNPVVYVGAKTGRDGIHGATMASAEFDDASEEKRPTVQVGDPFTEKLLLEACLELMAGDAIIAIQDMGAAGLTSSSVEMSSKGGVGITLDLDKVPVREAGMTPYEIMLSESQERMLMVLRPGREAAARAVFEKWELDFAIIGEVTDDGRLVLTLGGETVCDLEVEPLVANAPEYDRPTAPRPLPAGGAMADASAPEDGDLRAALLALIGCPDLCSKRWIWEQYDHMVMADTVLRPGADAAVVRIHGTRRGLAMTSDCTPRYCHADPVEGGRQAVAEAWRNVTAVGARPLAITDNMNFGNPERPEIMAAFAGCIEGMRDACLALDFPVVSGNVSFYNETNGRGIPPTPTIGAIGLIDDIDSIPSPGFTAPGETVIVLGPPSGGWLGCSLYLREILGREAGAPPPARLEAARAAGDLVRDLIATGLLSACHDIADGGLAVALAEMVMLGRCGAEIAAPNGTLSRHGWLFGEDQGRYVIATADTEAVAARARAAGVALEIIGHTDADADKSLTMAGLEPISQTTLRNAHEHWLPSYMAAP